MDLSIVIPAFNEAERLPASLASLAAYCAQQPRSVEIIIVDDGSCDATSTLPLPQVVPGRILWRRLRGETNHGKGFSVRRGMLAATGERRLFTDADLSAPIEELAKLDRALDGGADIAIGSRRCRDLIRAHQSAFRENAGRFFNRMVRFSLELPFVDTQCGFKLFTRACAEAVFPLQKIEGWGFDPELLFLARRLAYRVEEVPVVWSHAGGAKIRMFSDSLQMFRDMLRIRRLHPDLVLRNRRPR
ncbi:MAG: dolichyl-phosphate beta-glucosyltransferase [Terriglobales bacterium]